jgi:hypothetical protein
MRPSLRHTALGAVVFMAWGCAESRFPPVTVHISPGQPAALQTAAADLVADLEHMGTKATRSAAAAPKCKSGEVHITIGGVGTVWSSSPQAYEIDDERCGRYSRVLTLKGGALLSAQWAVYDLLDRLGVRYFHPEQTFYPPHVNWPASLAVKAAPAFQERSMHAHTTHPIELSTPLDTTGLDMVKYDKDWIDWNVKLRQSSVDGWDGSIVPTYAYDRGFPRGGGLDLAESEQNGMPLLDPAHPEEDAPRIDAAIDAIMQPVSGLPSVSTISFTFNPSEFNTAPADLTVARINDVAGYVASKYPGVEVSTINQGTFEEPDPVSGVRFFDLPEFGPPSLEVELHPLMFYDLERPAPVYGNENYQYLLDFARKEAPIRRITHFPETSWWLTFDEPVPLYLAPVTLDARQHDMDLLHDLVATDPASKTGVYGHNLFTSGEEWGYWLVDWCVSRLVWDLSYTADQCLDDFTGVLAKGDVIKQVLLAAQARQNADMRDPELIRFLVGSDDPTEAALATGVVFHPLPPQPSAVLQWDDLQAGALETNSLQPLREMATAYHAWAAQIAGLLSAQNASQASWVREIHDGLEVFGLRADHAVAVYETVLSLRTALAANDLAGVQAASMGVMQAQSVTNQARAVITAREADYRYPAALNIVGDEAGTPDAVPNETVYPYRYLSRTHRLFYWTRPDTELAALFGDSTAVQVPKRLFRQALPLQVSLLANGISNLLMNWGDGTMATTLDPHTYTMDGLYAWHLTAVTATGLIDHADQAAVVDRRFVFPLMSLAVANPSGASILTGLLPGFEIGFGDDGNAFLAMGRIDGATSVSTNGTLQLFPRSGNATVPGDVTLTLKKVGTVTLHQAVIDVEDGTGPDARTLSISGTLNTADIVSLLVQVGGFDPTGAGQLVAEVLGVQTLPETIPFQVTATGSETDN